MALENTPESPWRTLFERVRGALHNRRDAHGTIGSINWLRQGMAKRGANPNVVRNIIYRDKGKLTDKRVLFSLLNELWESAGHPPLEAPEFGLHLSATPAQGEPLQLLGRDKRRIYEGFVGAVQAGKHPKLLVTGRPGSGKTLLSDYLQEALDSTAQLRVQGPVQLGVPSPVQSTPQVVRQEFSAFNLADALLHFSLALGGTPQAFEAKLVKVGVAGAYSVQADAQAGVARVVLEQLRNCRDPLVLLLHVSQTSGGAQPGTLGDVPLRLNTPEVPRVGLTEWLWYTLLEPISHLGQVSLLVSMAELPLTLVGRAEAFEGPFKLNPPTTAEARRFVRAKAPQLPTEQQERLVGQTKGSFENLRTLTLLAEAREPHGDSSSEAWSEPQGESLGERQSHTQAHERSTEHLGQLVTSGSSRIRDFLEVLAVLSLPEFPAVDQGALETLRSAEPPTLTQLEQAFLDAVPGEPGHWRPFARQFSQVLRDQLGAANPERFRSLSRAASRLYEAEASAAPRSDAAARYAYYLFAARDWPELLAWAEHAPVPQPLLQRLWYTAQVELKNGADDLTLSTVALRVASYYVRLGSPEHPDAVGALAVLATSSRPELRSWALVKRAESALQAGRFGEAETLLDSWREVGGRGLATEVALLRANLARWHSRLSDAATHAQNSVDALASAEVPGLTGAADVGVDPLLSVRVGLWTGLVAKDQGEWLVALDRFRAVETSDELFRARLQFQEADVLYSLGRLGEAHVALDGAVTSSTRGEAPAFERARYYARRGTLARRRGEFSAARADFAAAQTVLRRTEEPLSLRLSFEQAKVQDEAALNLLATGRADDAITALQENQEIFAVYGSRYDVDPSFRVLRSRLRLAAAYGCRALAQRYGLLVGPYRETEFAAPDLQQARQLLAGVLGTLSAEPGRYAGLVTTAQLCSSLLSPPVHAVARAEAALADARYPYSRGLAGALYAGALLRRAAPTEARAALAEARRNLHDVTSGVIDDHALSAYLAAVDATALLCLDNGSEAHELVFEALQDSRLEPYQGRLLRHFGNAAEHFGAELSAAALGLGDAPLPSTLRPADALALRWQQRCAASAGQAEERAR